MKKKLLGIVLILFVGIIIGYPAIFLPDENKKPPGKAFSADPVRMQGINYYVHYQGILAYAVSIGEFRIAPRKFKFFSIKSINEILISDIKANLFLESPAEPKNAPIADSLNGKLKFNLVKSFLEMGGGNRRGVGLLTRATVKNIEVNIFNKDELTMKIIAPLAELSMKKQQLVLHNSSFERFNPEEKILAKSAILDTRNERILFPGWYEHIQKGKTIRAKGLSIDFH